jgi:hypothetical protein
MPPSFLNRDRGGHAGLSDLDTAKIGAGCCGFEHGGTVPPSSLPAIHFWLELPHRIPL